MYSWGQWSVEGARGALVHYQGKHQALSFDYVAAFDATFNSWTSYPKLGTSLGRFLIVSPFTRKNTHLQGGPILTAIDPTSLP
jgi:hypothetical protein